MKHCSLSAWALLFACLLVLNSLPTHAQYGNEWIASTGYDKTFYKFKTDHDGLHRITQGTLAAAGVPLTGANFKVFHRGQEIPIYVSNNGTLGSSDYIEFYGEANTGYFDTQLYDEEGDQANPYFSCFEDEGTYFLVSDPAANGLRFDNTSNDLSNVPAKETFFMYEAYKDAANTFHFGKPKTGVGSTFSFTADFGVGEGYTTSTISYLEVAGNIYNNKKIKVDTRGATTAGGSSATVTARVIGKNQSSGVYFDKDIDIRVNDDTYVHAFGSDPNVSSALKLHGYETKDYTFNIPVSELDSDETEVFFHVFDGVGTSGFPFETEIAVGFTTINYPRNFNFGGESQFKFDVSVPSTKYFEITNFQGGSAPVIYDLTSHKRIIPEVSGSTYKFKLDPTSDLKRTIFITSTSTSATEIVNGLSHRTFQNVFSSNNQGDYVIIYNDDLQTGCGMDQIQRYIDYRESAAGGNYTVAAYEIEDLYDQFAHGIEKHSMSIKSFINFAVDNWNPEAEIVNLIGKGVQYNLYRFFQEAEDFCLIPSYGHKASDLMLTSRTTTGFAPQVAIGRIPANNCDQVRAYLDKVVEYETLYDVPCDRDSRAWMNDALHIAKGWYDETDDFLDDLSIYEEQVTTNLLGMDVVETLSNDAGKISDQPCDSYVEYFEQQYDDQQQVRPHLENGLNFINYVGHSIYQNWQYDMGYPTDYDNEGKYPFILSNSCFVGKINEYNTCNGEYASSMAEDWVLSDNHGSIGFLAAVALSTPSFLQIYTTELMENLGTEPLYGEEIGLSVQQTVLDLIFQIQTGQLSGQDAEAAEITCYEFTYCGDPAIKLYSFEDAEFEMVSSDISVSDTNINSATDSSYDVIYEYHNNGKNVAGPIPIKVTQFAPNNTIVFSNIYNVENPVDGQTYTFEVPVVSGDNDGINTVTVTVDPNSQYPEQCEDNNSASLTINVTNPACTGSESAEFSFANIGASSSVCIDTPLEVSFDGNGGNLNFDFGEGSNYTQNGTTYTVSYASAGLKTVSFTVGSDDCITTETQQINVVAPLPEPDLVCVQNSEGILMVEWNAISGVNAYIVRINGGSATPTVSTSYSQFGVQPGETVVFEVQASGTNACGSGPIAYIECTAEQQTCTPPTVTNLNNVEVCEGESVSFSAQPAGGTYSVNGQVQTGSTIDNLGAGTYNIVYEVGEEDCKGSDSATITVNEEPQVDISGDIQLCSGEEGTITASGNFASYNWGGGNTNASLNVSSAGNYTVDVIDNNGCSSSASISVSIVQPVNLEITGNTTVCEGETSTLLLSETNVSNVSWSTGESGTSIQVNAAGNYSVSYTDANGCDGFTSIAVTESDNSNPQANFVLNGNETICAGETISFTNNSSNSSGYTWTLNNTATGDALNSSEENPSFVLDEAGVYNLTLRAFGCGSNEDVNQTSAIVTVEATPNVNTVVQEDCDETTGNATVTIQPIGATSYTVTTTSGSSTLNSGETITLPANEAVSVVGFSASGCQSAAIDVDTTVDCEQAGPDCTSFDVSLSVSDLNPCEGDVVQLNAVGAAAYSWSGVDASSGNTASLTSSGTITLVGSNADGCQDVETISVTFESKPELSYIISDENPCSGETVNITVEGAASFEWTGATNITNNTASLVVNDDMAISVQGESANGCKSDILNIPINVSPDPVILGTENLDCENGSFQLSGTNVETYTIVGDINMSLDASNPTVMFTPSDEELELNFTITAISPNGCTSSPLGFSFECIPTVDCSVVDLQLNASSVEACTGESVTVSASGADEITWSGATPNANNEAIITETTTIFISDINGCDSESVTINFNDIPDVDYNVSNTNPCQGEVVNITVSGAQSYQWTGNDTFDGFNATYIADEDAVITLVASNGNCESEMISIPITVKEVDIDYTISNINPCAGETVTINASGAVDYNWTGVPGAQGSSVSFVIDESTNVSLQGFDGNCSTEVLTIPITVVDNFDVEYSVSNTSPCAGETVAITVDGAANYNWVGIDDFDGSTAFVTVSDDTVINVQGFNGNCESDLISIPITVSDEVNINYSISNPEPCPGETVSIAVSGAQVYSWNGIDAFDGTNATITVDESTVITVQGTSDGCEGDLVSIPITVVNNVDFDYSVSDDTPCVGETVSITVSGANAYNWTGIDSFNGTTAFVTLNEDGVITLQGTDGNCTGDLITIPIEVQETEQLTITGDNLICDGETAVLTLIGTGITNISWNNGQSGFNANVSAPGDYVANYTDGNGCDGTAVYSVGTYPESEVNITGNLQLCEGDATNISLSGNGLNNINWSTGSTGMNTTILGAGDYSVTFSDEFGCTRSESFSVTVYEAQEVGFTGNTVICEGEASSIGLSGEGLSNIVWDNGNANVLTVTQAGTYEVSYNDINGCERSASVTISASENSDPIAGFSVANTPNICVGESITLLNNSQNSDSFEWTLTNSENGTSYNSLDFNPTILIDEAGTYSVELIARGCGTNQDVIAQSSIINVAELPSVDFTHDCIVDNATAELFILPNQSGTLSFIDGAFDDIEIDENGYLLTDLEINDNNGVEISASFVNEFGCSEIFNYYIDCSTPTGPDCSSVELSLEATTLLACEGEEVVVSYSGETPVQWSGATPDLFNDAYITETTTITIVDDLGCDVSETITIEFEALPELTYTVSNENPCAGEEVTIEINGAADYVWEQAGASGNSITFEAGEDITYSVSGLSENGCASEAIAIPITVQSINQVAVNFEGNAIDNGDSLSGCGEGSITYAIENADGYNWTGVSNVTANSITVDYTEGVNEVTATSTAACSADFAFTIESEENPSLNIVAPVGVCVGEEITVQFADVSGADYVISGGDLMETSSGEATATINETTTFQISYSTPEGCNDSQSFTVEAYEKPEVETSGNPEIVCLDSDFSLSVEQIEGYTYTWNGINASNIDGSSISLTADENMLGNITYELEVLSNEGCSTMYEIALAVQNKPDLLVFGENTDDLSCLGEDFIITASSQTGSVVWSGVGVDGLTDESVTVNISEAQTYTVVSTSEFGCERTETYTLNVYDEGTALNIPADTAVCSLSQFDLNLQEGVTATVDSEDNAIIDGEQIITVFNSVEVALDFNDENGCYKNGSFSILVDEELCPKPEDYLIPNVITPNGDSNNDTWDLADALFRYPDLDVLIYNRWGELLYEETGLATAWDGTRNDKDLPDGTYYYMIYLNDEEKNVLSGTITILR